MPIQLSWYDKTETVLLYQFKGHWNWQEFHKQIKVGREWASAKPYSVHLIVDFTDNRQLMTGMLQEVQDVFATSPGKTGKIVVVNPDHFLRLIYALVKQIEHRFPRKIDIEFASSVSAAYEMLLAENSV